MEVGNPEAKSHKFQLGYRKATEYNADAWYELGEQVKKGSLKKLDFFLCSLDFSFVHL